MTTHDAATVRSGGSQPLLVASGLTAGYGRVEVLSEIDITVNAGSVVALLGPNGAGKTTLLRALAGTIASQGGRIELEGRDVTRMRPERRAKAGMCLVPEGRGVFAGLTVRENLLLQGTGRRRDASTDTVLEVFPALADRMGQVAGTMSGGQQQMLALARTFVASPRVVLLDEVSMGLAPLVVDEIFEALARLRETGVAMLLVEQYVSRALDFADHVYLLDRGRVSLSSSPDELDHEDIARRYLAGGIAS